MSDGIQLTREDIDRIEQIDVTNEDLLWALARTVSGRGRNVRFGIDEFGERVFAEPIEPQERLGNDNVTFEVRRLASEDGVVDRIEEPVVVDGELVHLDAEVNVA